MAKNKPLNVTGYMQGVKDNQPTEKKNNQLSQGVSGECDANVQDKYVEEKPEVLVGKAQDNNSDGLKRSTEAGVIDIPGEVIQPASGNNQMTQEANDVQIQNPSTVQPKRGVGRPQKTTRRDQKQVFKLDSETSTNLMLIKAFNKFDLQDVIFTSLVSFLEKHFDRERGLDAEAVELINSTIDKYDTQS